MAKGVPVSLHDAALRRFYEKHDRSKLGRIPALLTEHGYGLLGEKQPPVGQLVAERSSGAEAVSDFRVQSGANLWDWLGTHLSLGLVRLKTVRISGTLHR